MLWFCIFFVSCDLDIIPPEFHSQMTRFHSQKGFVVLLYVSIMPSVRTNRQVCLGDLVESSFLQFHACTERFVYLVQCVSGTGFCLKLSCAWALLASIIRHLSGQVFWFVTILYVFFLLCLTNSVFLRDGGVRLDPATWSTESTESQSQVPPVCFQLAVYNCESGHISGGGFLFKTIVMHDFCAVFLWKQSMSSYEEYWINIHSFRTLQFHGFWTASHNNEEADARIWCVKIRNCIYLISAYASPQKRWRD